MRPVKLDEGVLSVEVDDPAWATQVKFLAPTIIARLAEVADAKVDRIQVRVDPRSARGARLELCTGGPVRERSSSARRPRVGS